MFSGYKLGRIARPGPPVGPTLDGHAMAARIAPAKLIRTHIPYQPIMGHNDECGDCTCVGLSNVILAQAALKGFTVSMPDDAPRTLYGEITGYPKQDEGAVEADVLTWQVQRGFDVGGQVPYAGLWATIDPGDLNRLRYVMAMLGSGYLGLALALADQHGGVWDTDTPASYGDPTAGSWGGHCGVLWDYDGTDDTSLVRIATWKTLQPATWRWVRSRMEEAHAVAHEQLLGADGLNAAGLDRDRLAAECAAA